MTTILDLMSELPPDYQREVKHFVQFLLQKKVQRPAQYLKLDWAGGLKEFRDTYTSAELQKKSLEWRGNDHVSS